jgi:hypothetical protein
MAGRAPDSSSSTSRLATRDLAPASLPPSLRLPPPCSSGGSSSTLLHIVQVLAADRPTPAAPPLSDDAAAAAQAFRVLPPGLHLFLDGEEPGPVLAAHLEGQLLPALLPALPSASLSTLRPLLRQFVHVNPAVADDLRRLLASEEAVEASGQLLWYHANDPSALFLPTAALSPLIETAMAEDSGEDKSSSLLGYHLTLSPSSAARLRTYTCASSALASAALPSAHGGGSAQLRLLAAEPPGIINK